MNFQKELQVGNYGLNITQQIKSIIILGYLNDFPVKTKIPSTHFGSSWKCSFQSDLSGNAYEISLRTVSSNKI